MTVKRITFRVNPNVENRELDALFADAWPKDAPEDYHDRLHYSLAYVCAYRDKELVGFVNVAWDGGEHAFLLDTTVRRDCRRQGIGTRLVRRAKSLARNAGCEWLHVDFDPELAPFYRACGFHHTEAGLINLRRKE